METKTMTAEQLSIEIARLNGWQWYRYTDKDGVWYILTKPQYVAATTNPSAYVEAPDYSGDGNQNAAGIPDYLTSITAAWPLIDLVFDPLKHAGIDDYSDSRCRWSFYWEQWSPALLQNITDPAEAARHISLAAYYALTGERVTLTD